MYVGNNFSKFIDQVQLFCIFLTSTHSQFTLSYQHLKLVEYNFGLLFSYEYEIISQESCFNGPLCML